MPTAIATKNTMNGTKRKGAPSKDAGAKDTKKPKIDSSKKATTKKPKAQPVKAKKRAEPSDSEDSDSDGGAQLFGNELSDSSDLEESDTTEYNSESKAAPAAKDGVHPDRAKAAAVNSRYMCTIYSLHAYNSQINRRRRHMRSKSSWLRRERRPNHWLNC
jgi:pumilio family protein 6